MSATESRACNICDGNSFEAGPGGRMARTGLPPRCSGCWSLERHRSLRNAFLQIPREVLDGRRALQFAPDGSLDPEWFSSYEKSIYGGENSIDLESIPREDGSYDFISLSHVLEFVADDRRAFAELVRVGSPSLVLHVTFASGMRGESRHFDEPQPPYGRFHDYGADMPEWLGVAGHGLDVVEGRFTDPVTDVAESAHFFVRSAADAEALRSAFAAAGSPVG
ncbi:MAG TPA: methyltransferase domain-containing protein [Thermoleophilaceae bacterium]|nr:methyltransferase domain-containing protein [Thermoleophilaceae bacterium]